MLGVYKLIISPRDAFLPLAGYRYSPKNINARVRDSSKELKVEGTPRVSAGGPSPEFHPFKIASCEIIPLVGLSANFQTDPPKTPRNCCVEPSQLCPTPRTSFPNPRFSTFVSISRPSTALFLARESYHSRCSSPTDLVAPNCGGYLGPRTRRGSGGHIGGRKKVSHLVGRRGRPASYAEGNS